VATTPARTTTERELVYNRLPLLRANRGISRNELAEALGIHYQTVGYIERGEYSPSLHLALRIARFFGLPVEAVFSTEPFGPLGAEALVSRPAIAPDPQEPPHA
jgi:DNA-binding XRE family transcriptional regulator